MADFLDKDLAIAEIDPITKEIKATAYLEDYLYNVVISIGGEGVDLNISPYMKTVLDDLTATAARITLGVGSIATQDADSVAISGGSVVGITDLTIADGGTGASTAGEARTNIDVYSKSESDSLAGHILQVKIVEDATAQTLATSTYTDTGLSVSITPISTSSTILCMWNMQAALGDAEGIGVKLLRDAINIYESGSLLDLYARASAGEQRSRGQWNHVDSPASTSALTYKVQVASNSSASITLNEGGNQSQLILMEVGG
jgi:hypothetical protein